VEGPRFALRCEQPGLYSEALIVQADEGSENRDFAQVCVYAPEWGREIAYGWAYHFPRLE
jgi:hypothetical protein